MIKGEGGTATQTHIGGTIGYQAPEVSTGKFSARVDMYSLAVMYFEMAVGKIPDITLTLDETLAPLRDNDDRDTCELMELMLKLKSHERPSADACARWIEQRAAREASTPLPLEQEVRARSSAPPRRHPWLACC